MKERIAYFLLGIIGVVLISVITHAAWDQYWDKTERSLEQVDVTTTVDNAIDGVMNPAFISYQDVMQYVMNQREMRANDSILLSMPSDVLQNITSVVIGRQGYAKIADLVKEYSINYNSLYKFIKDRPAPKEPDESSQPAPQETIKINGDTILYKNVPYKKLE